MGETATSQELIDIFTYTAQPIRSSIGRWLRDGTGMDAVGGEDVDGSLKQDQELLIETCEVP